MLKRILFLLCLGCLTTSGGCDGGAEGDGDLDEISALTEEEAHALSMITGQKLQL